MTKRQRPNWPCQWENTLCTWCKTRTDMTKRQRPNWPCQWENTLRAWCKLENTRQRDKGPTDRVGERMRDLAGGGESCCCWGGDSGSRGDVRWVWGRWLEAQSSRCRQFGKLLWCQHQLFGTGWNRVRYMYSHDNSFSLVKALVCILLLYFRQSWLHLGYTDYLVT